MGFAQCSPVHVSWEGFGQCNNPQYRIVGKGCMSSIHERVANSGMRLNEGSILARDSCLTYHRILHTVHDGSYFMKRLLRICESIACICKDKDSSIYLAFAYTTNVLLLQQFL